MAILKVSTTSIKTIQIKRFWENTTDATKFPNIEILRTIRIFFIVDYCIHYGALISPCDQITDISELKCRSLSQPMQGFTSKIAIQRCRCMTASLAMTGTIEKGFFPGDWGG